MGSAVCLCKRCFLCPLCRLCRKTTRRWPPCRKPSPRTSSSPTWMTTRGGRSLCQWLPWLALQWLRVLSWVLKGTPGWRRRLAWERRKCAGVFFCRLCVVVLSMLMLRKDLFCFQLELRSQPFRFALYQWKAEKGRLVTYTCLPQVPSHVDDVTGCRIQNGSAYDLVFATLTSLRVKKEEEKRRRKRRSEFKKREGDSISVNS